MTYEPPPTGWVWPISGSGAPDADAIRHPYGPRWIGAYDFHAGIDIPTPRGTPVHAVSDGTVVNTGTWDGVSRGSGTFVLIDHGNDQFAAYLHLDSKAVKIGDTVLQGQVIGNAGMTGATFEHLHFTYMIGLATTTDERKSRNPLEVLPHGAMATPAVARSGYTVTLPLASQVMTIKSIQVYGATSSRTVDYYDVVAQGSTPRNTQTQSGLHLDATAPSDGRYTLEVTPDPTYTPRRIVIRDFTGAVIVDKTF